jgi:hypothetical protein
MLIESSIYNDIPQIGNNYSAGFISQYVVVVSYIKTNEIMYMNHRTDEMLVSYLMNQDVIWTHLINDKPQMPHHRTTIEEFKRMVVSGGYESVESTPESQGSYFRWLLKHMN